MNSILNTDSWFHVGHVCIGAKDNSYQEETYLGPSSFVGAAELVHTEGSFYSCYFSEK